MTWAKSTMPDGVLSSVVCFQHSMRLRLAETSSSLPTARGNGRSVSRSRRPDWSESMQRRRCANSLWRSCRMPARATSSSELTISSAGSRIRTMTSSSLRSGFRTFPRAMPTGSGAACTTRFAPEAASSSWMPHPRSPRGTSFTVRNCPIATARPSTGDSRTVGRIGLSSARSIPTGSREIFVNTALKRALSRRASSSSTDSADVPSPTWCALSGRSADGRGDRRRDARRRRPPGRASATRVDRDPVARAGLRIQEALAFAEGGRARAARAGRARSGLSCSGADR
jgi:hypothetical protein